jgi:parallel beta-helix repeat protein
MTQKNHSCLSGLFPTKTSKAVFSVLLVALLSLSSFFVLYHASSGVSAQPNFLNVSVDGPKKLGVNEVGVYSASVNNSYSGNLEYSWSISPSDNKTVLVPDGSKCNLTFVVATDDAYCLSVSAKDSVVGNMGSASMAVYDPYTSPGYKFDASTATASYIITTDGLGWYRAIKGSTGEVSWTSTNPQTTLNNALAGGGTIAIKSGTYTGAVLTVPSNATIIAEQGVTGITYASIANGAKIDEPTFNSGFGKYSSKTVTISTNGTAYLAFKPDNSIYYFNSNFQQTWYGMHDALVDGSGIYLNAGNYPVTTYNASYSGGIGFNAKNNIDVFGAGKHATTIYAYNSTNPTLGLTWEPMIEIQACQGISFQDINFMPNSTTTTGDALDFDHDQNVTVKNCLFQILVGQDAAISIHADSSNVADYLITQNDFYYAGIAVRVFNTASYTITRWNVIANTFYGSTGSNTGIWANGKSYEFLINDNTFRRDSTANIYLNDARDGVITGNRFYGYGYGIQGVASYRMTVSGNNFGSSTGITGGAGWTVEGNANWITNTAVAGANTTSTTYVYAHLLCATPTTVVCSFNSIAITGYTWTANATHVVVTPAGTLPASWTTYTENKYQP